MEAQVITFDGVEYCTVFRLVDHKPKIIATCHADSANELVAWLQANGYPDKVIRLRARPATNLPHSCYIKPYPNERYFQVHEDYTLQEWKADDFDEPLNCTVNGF